MTSFDAETDLKLIIIIIIIKCILCADVSSRNLLAMLSHTIWEGWQVVDGRSDMELEVRAKLKDVYKALKTHVRRCDGRTAKLVEKLSAFHKM